jgi:hypothetical protein
VAVAAVIAKLTFAPSQIVWLMGCIVIAGLAPGFITKEIVVAWLFAPVAAPCKLILYVPDGKLFALLSVTIVLPPAATGLLLKVTLVPVGTPETTESVIGFAKPFIAFVLNVTVCGCNACGCGSRSITKTKTSSI